MALPSWPGAEHVYRTLNKVAEKLCADAYAKQLAAHRKRGRKGLPKTFTPPDEAEEIIRALNKGDEETLKGIQMRYMTAEFYGWTP